MAINDTRNNLVCSELEEREREDGEGVRMNRVVGPQLCDCEMEIVSRPVTFKSILHCFMYTSHFFSFFSPPETSMKYDCE